MSDLFERYAGLTWTPAEVEREDGPPITRARLDFQSHEQLQADLAIANLRAADQVARATDNLNHQFDRLIDAIRTTPRPHMLACPVGESRREVIQATPKGLHELTRVFLYGASGATGTATIVLGIEGAWPDMAFSVAAGTPGNFGLGLPLEIPREVNMSVTGGTGLWVCILVLSVV